MLPRVANVVQPFFLEADDIPSSGEVSFQPSSTCHEVNVVLAFLHEVAGEVERSRRPSCASRLQTLC